MPCRSADISHSSPSGCQHTVCLSRTPREGPGHGHLAIGLPSFQPDRRWCTVAPHNPPARSSNYRPHPQLELLSPCARAKSCWFFRSTKNLAVAVNETYYSSSVYYSGVGNNEPTTGHKETRHKSTRATRIQLSVLAPSGGFQCHRVPRGPGAQGASSLMEQSSLLATQRSRTLRASTSHGGQSMAGV
jgi:hypothetical protein